MKPRSFRWLVLLVLFLSSLAYGQTTRDSLYVRTLGSYPSGQSYSVKCFQNGGHDYALAVFGEGIRIVNIDSAAKPKIVSALSLYNSGHIIDIAIQGSFAYLSGSYDGLWIVEISDPYNPVKRGHCPLPTALNFISVNTQYAFAGTYYDETTGGLHIIDINDPDNPTFVTTYETHFALGMAARDTLVFVIFSDYGAGLGNLHILNVADPMDIKVVYADSINEGGVGLLLNGNYLYANVSDIYNVTDPANPIYYSNFEYAGFKYAIKDSALYGVSFGPSINIKKIINDTIIVYLPDQSAMGWASYVDVIGEKLCVSSYLSFEFNGVAIYDISVPFAPHLASYISEINSYNSSFKLCAKNDTVVIGGRGIEVYDAVGPNKPTLITFFHDTAHSFDDVIWHQDYIYALEAETGLWVYDFSSKETLRLADTVFCLANTAASIAVESTTVYVGVDKTLKLVDISNPDSLKSLGQTVFTDYVWAIAVKNDLAYIANGQQGLYIYNTANKDSLYEVGHCPTPGSACEIVLSGNYAYVADYDSGLTVIDISESTLPLVIGNFDTPGLVWHIAIDSNLVYLMDDSVGLKVIEVSVPSIPQEVGHYSLRYYELGMGESYNYMKSICSGVGRIYANTLYGLQIYEYYGPNGVESNDSESKHKYLFKLLGSYPNPTVNSLAIDYEVATSGLYELSVYNVLGQKISLLDKGNKVPGKYTLKWDCKDANGNKVAPGVYFYQIRDKENNRITKKTVVIK